MFVADEKKTFASLKNVCVGEAKFVRLKKLVAT